MTLLKSEMDKICAKAEDFTITRADIDSVIRNVLVESVFTLIDSVIYKRRDIAFDTLANLEQLKIEPVSIIPIFADQVLGVYKAKLMMTQKMSLNEIKQTISRNPYVADKMVQKASKITIEDLETLIKMLTEAEYKSKNGLGDAWYELYMIVAN
jgi:DNA polymerase III delta subunit